MRAPKLVPIYIDTPLLRQLADWRRETPMTLRSTYPTGYQKQAQWIESMTSEQLYYFILKESNCLALPSDLFGYCGLDKIHLSNGTAEISLLIGPGHRVKGIGRAVVTFLCDIAFNQLNLNCIYAEVYDTTSTWKFWGKCGFLQEGKLRQRKYWKGRYYDSIIASILKSEFQSKQKEEVK